MVKKSIELDEILLILSVLTGLIYAISSGFYFDAFPADGAFQTFNPLNRISHGQIPGKDFDIFHGIGITWIYYPLYFLLGETLLASVISSGVISFLGFTITCWLLIKNIFNKQIANWVTTVTILISFPVFSPFSALSTGGNSNLSIRTLPTMFLLISLILINKYNINYKLGSVIVGVILGINGVIDTGSFVANILIVIILLIWGIKKKISDAFSLFSYTLISALSSIFLLLTIGTGNNIGKVIEYSYSAIPEDQFWYFGGPPNNFLIDLEGIGYSFLNIYGIIGIIGIIVLLSSFIVGLLIIFSKNKYVLEFPYLWIFKLGILSTGITGLVSSLGMFSIHYFYGYLRIIWLALLYILISKYLKGITLKKINHKQYAKLGKISLIFITSITLSMIIFQVYLNIINKEFTYIKEIGYKAGPAYSHSYTMNTHIGNKKLFSTYGTILEIIRNNPQPSGFDYIIHALGTKRRIQYENSFLNYDPDFVQTIRPDYFLGYEYWLLTSNWNIYRHIIYNYTPVYKSPYSYLWRKNTSTIPSKQVICTKGDDGNYVTIENNLNNQVVDVSIKLSSQKKTIFEGILTKIRRDIILPSNTELNYPISINRNSSNISIPIVLNGKSGKLYLQTFSIGERALKIEECTATSQTVSQDIINLLKENNLTASRFGIFNKRIQNE